MRMPRIILIARRKKNHSALKNFEMLSRERAFAILKAYELRLLIQVREIRVYMNEIVYVLVVGLIAGWLAGKIMKGKGFGLAGDLVVGVLGAIVGSWLFAQMGVWHYGILGSIIVALLGALLLLYLLRLVKKRN
jgi:uncharacterized membrane protein YeaQ/YmgE (transglycosylase-associated protein family)